jgi:hypothetical protein
MHDLCWFKPSRAYVLGLYLDTAALNRIRTHPGDITKTSANIDCPKTFVLFFAADKDLKHIRKGFERSYYNFMKTRGRLMDAESSRYDVDSPMGEFLNSLGNGHSLKKGDRLQITCTPSMATVHVSMTGGEPLHIQNASLLIEWLHSLYLGLESQPVARYRGMQEKLLNSSSV